MEMLHIHRSGGEHLASVDLAGRETQVLTIGAASSADLSVKDFLRPEDGSFAPVAAALVRDDDGWLLASADPDVPVMVGDKPAADVRLTPGQICRLGPFLFSLERDVTLSAATLLWHRRHEKPPCRADPLGEGRNTVAWLPDGSTLAVNPAVAGEPLFDLVLEGDVATILAGSEAGGSTRRLTVRFGERFSVGLFSGVVLASTDAACALKSRAPLRWPGRIVRSRVRLYAVCGVLLALLMLMIARKTQEARVAVAARGKICRELPAPSAPVDVRETVSTLDEDILVYDLDFHRSLPALLNPAPQPNMPFLVTRAEALLRRCAIAPEGAALRPALERKQTFLRDLAALKSDLAAERWMSLRDTLAAVDREAFLYYEGQGFLDDASELCRFLTETLPGFYAAASEHGSAAFAKADARLSEAFGEMADNRFMDTTVSERQQNAARIRWEALRRHVAAREAFFATPDNSEAVEAVREGFAALEAALDGADAAQSALLTREREALAAFAMDRIRTLMEVAAPHAADAGMLRRLARLIRSVGYPHSAVASVETAAEKIDRTFGQQWRVLHAQYRLQRLSKTSGAEKTLDEMLALGPAENPFYFWALRERKRLAAFGKETMK